MMRTGSSVGRAPASQAGGRGFDSRPVHHNFSIFPKSYRKESFVFDPKNIVLINIVLMKVILKDL